MRISTSQFFTQALRNMLEQQNQVVRTQNQLGQGLKNLTPSDDPSSAARVIGLTQSIHQLEQFNDNGIYAKQRLEQEETTLDSVVLLLDRTRELAINAGNVGIHDQNSRQAIVTELRERIDELLDYANTRDANGDYLFSGSLSGIQSFVADGVGGYSYNGDQTQMSLQIGSNRQVAVSDSGADVFQLVRTGNGKFSVDAGLQNNGTGVMTSGSVTNTQDFLAHDYTLLFEPTDATAAAFTGSVVPTALDYSATPATFDISIDGGTTTAVTFNTDMTGQPPLVIAKALAATINNTYAQGVVTASVDANNQIVLSTVSENGTNSSIQLSNLNATATTDLGLAVTTVTGTDQLTDSVFNVIDNTLTPGTVTSADIGAAGVDIYTQDEAAVTAGTNDVSGGADFNAGGPTRFDLIIDNNTVQVNLSGTPGAGQVASNVQAAVDSALGAGVVSVTEAVGGLITFSTVAVGKEANIRIDNVVNNVLGLTNGQYASGFDQNNIIELDIDGSGDIQTVTLTGGTAALGTARTATDIAAEINAVMGVNATASASNEIIINSDNLGQNAASLLLSGNVLATLGLEDAAVTVGQTNRAYSDDAAILFDGRSLSVRGEPNGNDRFTVRASRNQDIFTTLQNLADDLENPPNQGTDLSASIRITQSIAIALDNMSRATDNIIEVQTGIGARLNSIESQEEQNYSKNIKLQEVRSELQDLDYAEAISNLNFQMTALQAAQQSFVQVQNLSLFNFL